MKIKFTLILSLLCLGLANRAPAPTFSDANWISMGASNFFPHGFAVAGKSLYTAHATIDSHWDPISYIRKWDGSTWREFGSMFGQVQALAGSGSDLYLAKLLDIPFCSISKWNGSNWNGIGSVGDPPGPGGTTYPGVYVLAASGSDLYVGGRFNTAGNSTPATNFAKWNGSSWSGVGSGMNGSVSALAFSGSDLYAGGSFTKAGGIPANYVAKWDGSNWSPLGSGMNAGVIALAVSGSDLYAAGAFTNAGGISANRIAKWNGSSWSALGSGINSTVNALAVSGTDLYAAGDFTTAGGSPANYIAKWDGSTWSALGSGMNGGGVSALAVSDNDLYVAGGFSTAGGKVSRYFARGVLGDAPGYNHLTPTRLSGSPMRFSYIGYPATNYALDRAFNLAPPINWVGQQTNTMPPGGLLIFINTPAPGTNNFWRVRSVP